jgi:methylase of polypeptide subunit release factors
VQKIFEGRGPHPDAGAKLQKEWLFAETGSGSIVVKLLDRRRGLAGAGTDINSAAIDLAINDHV